MRVLLAFLLAAQPATAAQFFRVQTGGRVVPVVRMPFQPPRLASRVGFQAPLKTSPLLLGERLQAISLEVVADHQALGKLTGEGSRAMGQRHLALLLGERLAKRPVFGRYGTGRSLLDPSAGFNESHASPEKKKPEPPKPEQDRAIKLMRFGTSAFKVGMEVVRVGIPLMIGGATGVALLAVTYGVSQAGLGSIAGALTDRFPASKVLSGALVFQAALVTAVVAFGAAGLLSPWLLFPLYGLIGAAASVVDASRNLVPTLVLGQGSEEALNRYNGSLHVYYETAGVAGALLAGVLLASVGPLYALAIMPPAYALAAFLFWKVRHPFARKQAETKPESGPRRRFGAALKAYAADIKEGVRTLAGDKALRWIAAAMVLPQIVHRVFEDLLLPVYAREVLLNKTDLAWMTAASNMGELVGALLLLKFAERFKGPSSWVRWAGLGLLLAWALVFSHSLPVLLPIILVFSMTWASSELSLRSALQARLSERTLPRVWTVLTGLVALLGVTASLLLGPFMDAVPIAHAVAWVVAGFSAVGVLVWLASRRLKK